MFEEMAKPNCHVQTILPEHDEDGSIRLHIEAILDKRDCRLHQHIIEEILIQWKDMHPKYANCEPSTISQQCPHIYI